MKTGESAFEKAHGMPVFDYFARDARFARTFSDAMTVRSAGEARTVCGAFAVARVVDTTGTLSVIEATRV